MAPNKNARKYLAYAQLLEGLDSVKCIQKGIDGLYEERRNCEDEVADGHWLQRNRLVSSLQKFVVH